VRTVAYDLNCLIVLDDNSMIPPYRKCGHHADFDQKQLDNLNRKQRTHMSTAKVITHYKVIIQKAFYSFELGRAQQLNKSLNP